jgi:hypothetical protein
MARRVQVTFPVPREQAFDFLVHPRNRTRWQSSLREVGEVQPLPPQVGTRWSERAVGGVVSRMRLTVVDRPRTWAETGTFRGITMALTLSFAEAPGGCLVAADVSFHAHGPWRVVAPLAARIFPFAIRSDLARAARLLGAGRQPDR